MVIKTTLNLCVVTLVGSCIYLTGVQVSFLLWHFFSYSSIVKFLFFICITQFQVKKSMYRIKHVLTQRFIAEPDPRRPADMKPMINTM
jgi:hypothetical protein